MADFGALRQRRRLRRTSVRCRPCSNERFCSTVPRKRLRRPRVQGRLRRSARMGAAPPPSSRVEPRSQGHCAHYGARRYFSLARILTCANCFYEVSWREAHTIKRAHRYMCQVLPVMVWNSLCRLCGIAWCTCGRLCSIARSSHRC